MKIWPILQSFLAPVEQTAMEIAVPIAEAAVRGVFASNPILSPFEAIGRALLNSAEAFAEQQIHPNTAVTAVTHAVWTGERAGPSSAGG